jgi:fatty acid-binding protein DegV
LHAHPTQGKSWARLIELVIEASGGCAVEQLAILHVNAPEAAHQFELHVLPALTCPPEMRHAEMAHGLSIHSGTGLVGIVLVMKKKLTNINPCLT